MDKVSYRKQVGAGASLRVVFSEKIRTLLEHIALRKILLLREIQG
jgi:hypothetical protein